MTYLMVHPNVMEAICGILATAAFIGVPSVILLVWFLLKERRD